MNVVFIGLFVAFLWGTQAVVHKHVLKTVNPAVIMVLSTLFYLSCLLVFWFINSKTVNNGIKKLTPVNWLWIGIAAVFMGFLSNLIYYYILQKHDSYIISALIYSSPFFTFILAYLFLKEKVTLYSFVGIIFIVCGVILLALNEKNKLENFLDFKN